MKKIQYNYSSEFGEFLSRKGIEEVIKQTQKKTRNDLIKEIKKEWEDCGISNYEATIFYKSILKNLNKKK